MMGVMHRANRVAQSMNCPQALLEGGSAHDCRTHHMSARLDICTIGIGPRQIALDQPHALQRYPLAHRVIMRRAERLDTMRKGINSCAGSDGSRHAHRELRIAYHN